MDALVEARLQQGAIEKLLLDDLKAPSDTARAKGFRCL
jgi:hypothetical protein